jgi:hypothetical protein
LYRSVKGKSKFKHYQKAYQDALRKAFKSFQSLNVNQPETMTFEVDEVSENPEVVNKNLDSEKSKQIGTQPNATFSSYSNRGKLYILRKTKEGYSLYEESNSGDLILKGSISSVHSKLKYLDIEGNAFDTYFDTSGNLNIFISDKTSVYKALDQ